MDKISGYQLFLSELITEKVKGGHGLTQKQAHDAWKECKDDGRHLAYKQKAKKLDKKSRETISWTKFF
jgi:hypothetical protein